MAEYIEREAVAEFLKGEIQQCESELAESDGEDDRYEQAVESRMIGLVDAWRKVTNTAAADVVEVVRCKDCKYYRPQVKSAQRKNKTNYCCRTAVIKVKPNDFCSYGEAKMDGKGETE